MPFGPMLRVIHADARAFDDGERFNFFRRGDVKVVAQEVVRVEATVNVHRAAEQARPLRATREVLHRLDGAQQHGGGVAGAFGDDVHAVVHSVDEINISVTRRAEHDFGPLRQSFGRMRGEIVRAEIGFRFHDFADAFHALRMVDEDFAEQFPGDENCVPVVE